MKRRTMLIGAGGAALAAIGVGASQSGIITGPLTGQGLTRTAPGVFNANAGGLNRLSWERGTGKRVELAFEHAATPPDFIRVHNGEGRKKYEDAAPAGGSSRATFGLPLRPPGTWSVVTRAGGSHVKFELPIDPAFAVPTFGLDGNTVRLVIENQTDSPNLIKSYRITHERMGHGKTFEPNHVLMPGDSFSTSFAYPFEYYEGVELSVTGADTTVTRTGFV